MLRFARLLGIAHAHVICSHGPYFTPAFVSLGFLDLSSTSTPMPVSPSPFRSQYKPEKYDICMFSVSLVLALRPLVRNRPLPAHLRVALPRRRILPSSRRIQPLRHLRQPRLLRKGRPPLALVYSDRWLPPRAPSPSDQLLAMASRRCFLAAAPSPHL